jgi:hypothetical protein
VHVLRPDALRSYAAAGRESEACALLHGGHRLSCLAAPCGARALSRAKRERIARQQNTVTSSAKPVRSKEGQGWGLSFGLPLRPFRPIKLSRNK